MPIIEVCWCNNNDRGATITISWLPCCLSLTILRFRHILRKYTYSIVQKFLNSSIYQHLLVALSYPNQWNQVLLLLYLFKKKKLFFCGKSNDFVDSCWCCFFCEGIVEIESHFSIDVRDLTVLIAGEGLKYIVEITG